MPIVSYLPVLAHSMGYALSYKGNALSCRLPSSLANQVLRDPNQVVSCVLLLASLVAVLQLMVGPRTSSRYISCRLPVQAPVRTCAGSLDCGADRYTPVYRCLAVSCAPNPKGTSTALLQRLETR